MPDAFGEMASYYDVIMSHVNYDRWFVVVTTLSQLLPQHFLHVDVACGTCRLVNKLRRAGWRSVGMDLSHAMVRAGNKEAPASGAVADLRSLPLSGSVDLLTCLFDSINFLPTTEDVSRAFRQAHDALKGDGLFYFDIITERMVTEYFAGQRWTEQNGRFATTWESRYDKTAAIVKTHIRVQNGPECTVVEHIYKRDEIESALDRAGLQLIGVFDAPTWRAPGRRTVRIDYVAAKGDARRFKRGLRPIEKMIQRSLA